MLVFLIEVDTRVKILSIYDANGNTNLGHKMKFSNFVVNFYLNSPG